MSESNESLVSRVISGFGRIVALGLLSAAATGCVSEKELGFSDFPVRKVYESQYYAKIKDDPKAVSSDRSKLLYNTLGFDERAIAAKWKDKRQVFVRLKRTDGRPNHGPDCITNCIPNIPHGFDGDVTVTMRGSAVEYILSGVDNKSFVDITCGYMTKKDIIKFRQSYDKDLTIPNLTLTSHMWPVGKDYRVQTPLPAGFKQDYTHKSLTAWEALKLDSFTRGLFGCSLLGDEEREKAVQELFEAEYRAYPDEQLDQLDSLIGCINGIKKDPTHKSYTLYLHARAETLKSASELYKRLSQIKRPDQIEPEIAPNRRGKIKNDLNTLRKELLEEYNSAKWPTDFKGRERKAMTQIYLGDTKTYLGVEDKK